MQIIDTGKITCPLRLSEGIIVRGMDEWKPDRWTREQWAGSGIEMPRTCSHCAGLHPKDVIFMVLIGWRLRPTRESFRRVLEPPIGEPFKPPHMLKVYLPHFTDKELEELYRAHCAANPETDDEEESACQS